MRVEEINYSETIELAGMWKKIGIRASLDESDDRDECFHQLQATVKQWQQSSPQPRFERVANEIPIPIVKVDEHNEPPDMIAQINSCKDIITLETYKLLSRQQPDWQDAYRKKLCELSNAQ